LDDKNSVESIEQMSPPVVVESCSLEAPPGSVEPSPTGSGGKTVPQPDAKTMDSRLVGGESAFEAAADG